nr:NUDIX domain-containing protein [Nonomuraea fuscirosea]
MTFDTTPPAIQRNRLLRYVIVAERRGSCRSDKSEDVFMPDDPWQPPRILLAVDLVILTLRAARLHVLLVNRGIDPFRGALALPGGFLADEHEDIEAAARCEPAEEAGLSGWSTPPTATP